MSVCHCCEENEADFDCPDCDEPTCEDCFEPCTQFNAGNPQRCMACVDDSDRAREAEYDRESAIKRVEDAKKERRNAAARERYWRPGNVEKRRKARIELRRGRAELAAKSLEEAFRIFGSLIG